MALHVYVQNINTRIVQAGTGAGTTMVVDTNVYAALDVIGGKLKLPQAVRLPAGTGVLQSITITDDDNEKAAFDVLLFSASPTGTVTDNLAYAHSAADLLAFLGRVQVVATDYLTIVAGSLAVASIKNIGLLVKAASGSADLYAVVIATGTPTYTATTDLQMFFGVLCD